MENWKTSFNETTNQMIHDFGGGYKIVTDFETKMCFKFKDGEIKDKFEIDGMKLDTYTLILLNFKNAIEQ